MTTSTATLVLAAGGSRRMGSAPKLLEAVGGEPMIVRAAHAALDASLGPVLVVTGDQSEAVVAALPSGTHVVRNPLWREGLSTSLIAGIAALPSGVDVVLIALGDMPLVTAHHHRTVAAAWRPGHIVVPVHQGHPGHPVALAATFLPELLLVEGDSGARRVVLDHPDAVIELSIDDPGIVTDVDDPAALIRVQRQVSPKP